VITALVIVELVLSKFETVDVEDTSRLLAVTLVNKRVDVEIAVADKVPFKFTLPSVDVKYAGDISNVFLLAGIPKLLVMTRVPVPVEATTTNTLSSGLHVRPYH
jgi:hypothetical protein